MTFPVLVELENGEYAASVAGAPKLKATGRTRPEALRSLEDQVAKSIALGHLAALDVETSGGILALAGKCAHDPDLQEICDEAYRERDRDRDSL